MSPSNVLLIVFMAVSLLSFSCRYIRTPSSVVCINTKVAAPSNFLSISLCTCGLLVINIGVSDDPCRICARYLRTIVRCSGTSSSSASTHINVPLVPVMLRKMFKIPEICSLLPQLFSLLKAPGYHFRNSLQSANELPQQGAEHIHR